MTILVTRKGEIVLRAKILTLSEEYTKLCRSKAEAYENGGNGWHDNFAYEDLMRQEKSERDENCIRSTLG